MSIEYIDTINLPTWAVDYLVNGDSSGISEEDIATVDQWLESLDHHCVSFDFDCDGEILGTFFTQYPEFGLACECEQVDIHGHRKA